MKAFATLPFGIATLSCLIAPLAATAQPVRDHVIEAEDYFTLAVVTSCALSPDGDRVAYTDMRWEPPNERRNSDIWVVSAKGGEPERLTFDKAGDGGIVWSPDGKHIYFRSARKIAEEEDPPHNGKAQVWRIDATGGIPRAITNEKDGIGLFTMTADGRTLYYTTTKKHVDDEWKDLKESFSDLEYGHGVTKFGQVWKLDLKTWRKEKVIDENRVIVSMHVSPDGRRLGLLTTPDEELIHNEGWSRIDVLDVASGEIEIVTPEGWRADHPSPFGWIDDFDWARDGNALAFSISFDGYPTQLYAAERGESDWSMFELPRTGVVSATGGTLHWKGRSRTVCYRGDDRARARVFCIRGVENGKHGKTQVMTEGDVVVGGYSFDRDGDNLAVVMSSPTHTEDVFMVRRGDKYDRLTNVNKHIETWKLPQISVVEWKGDGGKEVEGILELPPDHKPGTPLPMVVEIHGGPTSATSYNLRFWIYGRTLMPSKGYALFSPNYRGSTGYGDEFMVDLVGRENDVEVNDIMLGVDAMIERGIADPDRLAVMGWSNGGYLTNCLIAKTNRFKAASSGAGVFDQTIQWGTEDTPGHVINFMNALPWENPKEYQEASPVYEMASARTPTIIHVGEHDERVPAAHARALFRSLKYYLDVPTELIVYPGEGHGLTTYTHRKAKMKWDLAWFDRFLGMTPAPDGDAPAKEDGAS